MKRYRRTYTPADARRIYFGTTAVVTAFVGRIMIVAAVMDNSVSWWERLFSVLLPTVTMPAFFAFLFWLKGTA